MQQQGRYSFVVFERAAEVGGTWRDNSYPGCGCDIPAPLYSSSFAPNPDWSRLYAGQGEILGYIQHAVAQFNIGACRLLQTPPSRGPFSSVQK